MPNKSNRQKPPTTSQKNRILSAASVLTDQNPNPLYQDPDVAYVNLLPENIDATIARIRASNGNAAPSMDQQQALTSPQVAVAAAPSGNQPHIDPKPPYQATGRPRRASTAQNLAASIESLISGNGNGASATNKLPTEMLDTARPNASTRKSPLHSGPSQAKHSPLAAVQARPASTIPAAASNGDKLLVGRPVQPPSSSPVILVEAATDAASVNRSSDVPAPTRASKRSSKRGSKGGSKHDAKRVCKRSSKRIPKHCPRHCSKHCAVHCAMRCITRRARHGPTQDLKPCSRHRTGTRSMKQNAKPASASKMEPNNDLRHSSKSDPNKKHKKPHATPAAPDKMRKRKEPQVATDTTNAGNVLSILPRNVSNVIANLRVDNSSDAASAAAASNAATADNSGASNAGKRPADSFQQLPQAYANLMPINITNSTPAKNDEKLFGESRYVGINVDSVRCIWDQSGCNDFKIHSFAMQMMAEDTSYKLWELVNSLQAYTLHSGGILTASIVNEVLKDFNVPPITHAESTKDEWEKINHNGIYYAKPVVDLNLSEEYSRPDWVKDFGRLTLEAEWRSPQENGKLLKEFSRVLITCIMMGGEIPHCFGLLQAATNSSVGSILPMLLTKFCEFLAFGVDDEVLQRALAFLKAISHSYYARDMSIEVEHYHLANILVCLLFGPMHEMQSSKRTRREMESQRLANARTVHRLQKLLVVPREQQSQPRPQQQQKDKQRQLQPSRAEPTQQRPRETVHIGHGKSMNSNDRADEQLRLVKKAQKTLTDSLRQTQKEHLKKERLLRILAKHEAAAASNAERPSQSQGAGLVAADQSQASAPAPIASLSESSETPTASADSSPMQSTPIVGSSSMEASRPAISTADHHFLQPSLPPISKTSSGSKDSRRSAKSKSSSTHPSRSPSSPAGYDGKDAGRATTPKQCSSTKRASPSQASSSSLDPNRTSASRTSAPTTPTKAHASAADPGRASKPNATPNLQSGQTNYSTEPIIIDSDQESSDDDAGDYLFSNEYYWDTINEWPRGWPNASPDVEANEFVSPYEAPAVDERFVDEVCAVIGGMSGLWGYLEHEIIYLLSQRMHMFFSVRRSQWTANHFNWLSRMIRAATSLGDLAFRELSVYFGRVPSNATPEWIVPLLSVGGQFVYHQDDEYLYEYLNEVCADSLQPYLIEYTKHLERLRSRRLKKQSRQVVAQRVVPATTLRVLPRPVYTNRNGCTQHASLHALFPDYATVRPKKGIKIQNSRTSPPSGHSVQTDTRPVHQTSCSKLNRHVVLSHRRLLGPVHIGKRRKPTDHLFDNKLYNL